ncbi:ABC transporter substrate-binding protein [Aurantimonas sp. MSK8Z-1]|uniref:ABC transporter substrate-binding protein n=1 Tax=Mangrovibrevibacter kandeliae TaxID=2968473 RepID=UPI002118D264|nr:ABC transporter substrate-binding protein [Aurantimonas sp. MSK8Z-1]MCW4115744.1 ABC transporter substrate-binding protein [Aurantimonas sp. MSK8Z-1]
MSKLRLSIAVGDYDRTRPLIDGTVQIDGVDPVFMTLDPEEIFFRAFRHAEFDVSELSLSSFSVKTARDDCPYVGMPVFLSRAFRHTSFYVNTGAGIARPEDLRGKRVGVPEYQLTACVWGRAILKDEYGVDPSEITWVRGGIEQPGRPEKIAVDLPEGTRLENAPEGRSLSDLLLSGEIDAMLTPRAPSCFDRGDPRVGWLFADPVAVAKDYYARTKLFPIMHLTGLRREIAEAHPWLPGALLKAFSEAKAVAARKLSDTSATKVTLPFVEERLQEARILMGPDFWSYGYGPNRETLDVFLKHHHAQGLSPRQLEAAELFHPATLEAHRI